MLYGSFATQSEWEVEKMQSSSGDAASKARRKKVQARAEALRTAYHEQVDEVLEYLRTVRATLLETEAYCNRIAHLRDMAGKATGRIHAFRSGVTSGTSNVERFVLELCDLEKRLSGRAAQFAQMQTQAQQVVDCLPKAEHRTVLTLRYLRGMRWEDIADTMQYAERSVMRMHRESLLVLSDLHRRGLLPVDIRKEA